MKTFVVVMLTVLFPALLAAPARAESQAGPVNDVQEPGLGPSADFSVAFVALDGVRAQEVFQGADRRLTVGLPGEKIPAQGDVAPHIDALARGAGVGVGMPGRGRSLRASGPRYVSLPGYVEMLTGRGTSCTHNDCDVSTLPTILSEVASMPGVARGEVVAFSSWSRLGPLLKDERGAVLVSAGRKRAAALEEEARRSGLAAVLTEGRSASPAPGRGDYRPDRHTAALALNWVKTHHSKFVFVGLGDADEHAHRGDYLGYLRAIRFADRVVGQLSRWLDDEHSRGRRTLLVITTDHGRAASFVHHERERESGDVWMVAGGSLAGARGVVELDKPRRLRDIVPSIRPLLGLSADRSRRAGSELCRVFRPCP